MKVFSKYLIKSMFEKKGRTLLLLISIAISAGLLVASLGSVKALLGTITTQVKGNLGDYNVQISPRQNLEVPLFTPVDLKGSFKLVAEGGYLSDKTDKEFSLDGTTMEDIKNYNLIQVVKQENLEPFTGKKIIISQKASDTLKVKLGDEIKVNILGKEDSYKVAGIAANRAIFFQDTDKRFEFLTPEENVFSIYGVKNKYSMQFAIVDSKDLTAWVKDFNDKHKNDGFVASKIYDEEAISSQLDMLKTPLYFMLVIVLLMTTFIIYSSFKLIITERLPVIGVFLSQGATKWGIIKLLLRESLGYGVIGGLLGCAIGAGLTNLVAILTNPFKDYGVKATLEYYPEYLVAGFIFALILCFVSTLIPILSIRKLPIKDVILNTLSTSNQISLKGFIAGIVSLILATMFHFMAGESGSIASVLGLFLVFIGVILIIPKLVEILCTPIVKILRKISGMSMLAFNNVKTSKVLVNNIRLISVAVISIVMISALRITLVDTVTGVYKDLKWDVMVQVNSNNAKSINDIINENKNIIKINRSSFIMANLNGDSSKMMFINPVDPEDYKTFETYITYKDINKEMDALNANDDGIIISKQIATRFKINIGDVIDVKTENKDEKMKVLSIADAKLENMGNFNLISFKGALKHFDLKYPSIYYISTKEAQATLKTELETKLKGLGASVSTKDELQKSNIDSNKQITDVIGIFSYVTMVIGAFGILSNVSISFIQRKREIAVLSSVGLSKSSRGYMILIEGIFQALIGAAISFIAAEGVLISLTDIFKFLTMDLPLKYPFESLVTISFATLILMILTSLSSMRKSRKMVIVDVLRYE